MKNLLRLESVGLFALGLFLYSQLGKPWWLLALLILPPDLSMLGYLHSARTGAWTYNLVHHKAVGIAAYILGLALGMPWLALTGVVLFTHSAMDRVFGYGLKFEDDFQHTHLGWIGQGNQAKPV
jgi:hypothetical protein